MSSTLEAGQARRRAPSRRNAAGVLVGVTMALVSAGTAELGASDQAAGGADDHQQPEVIEAVEELLGQLEIAEESTAPYDRGAFSHWSDLDRDGCKTRAEVLIAERRAGRVQGCQVIGGRWYSTYDGVTVTDAGALDVDHVVALGEAWDSGAQEWDAERRKRYANDVGYRNALIAVTERSNSQKSDRDPADWVPTRRAAWCRYATAWTTVKIRWGLSADVDELAALRELLATCRQPPETVVALAR